MSSRIGFRGNKAMTDYLSTRINVIGCSSCVVHEELVARVVPGPGTVSVRSDLPGLES